MKNYQGYEDYRGTWKMGPTQEEIRKAVTFYSCSQAFLEEVTGNISSASQAKWFPRTQWTQVGDGMIDVRKHETVVIDVDAAEKTIASTRRRLFALDGRDVRVFRRCSPLRYNGYYWDETIWLGPGENLPPDYPAVQHNSDPLEHVFGGQMEQAECVPA